MKIKLFLLSLLLLFVKLDASQPRILAIKRISIPGYPDALNGSIVPYGEGYLLAFRDDIFPIPMKNWAQWKHRIGLVLLDKNYKAIGDPQIFHELGDRSYDPRLCFVNNELYLSFGSADPKDENSMISAHMNICKVSIKKDQISVTKPLDLRVPFQNIREKNWVMFEYKNNLLFSYSINPHTVLIPKLTDGFCKSIYKTGSSLINWRYGEIRGGTSALLVDGDYLAFFHSSRQTPKGYRYFMGAYKFSSEPPFQIKKISKKPLVDLDFYTTKKNGKTCSDVVFPGSFHVEGDIITVCYGENDASIKILQLNKQELYDSLINVQVK